MLNSSLLRLIRAAVRSDLDDEQLVSAGSNALSLDALNRRFALRPHAALLLGSYHCSYTHLGLKGSLHATDVALCFQALLPSLPEGSVVHSAFVTRRVSTWNLLKKYWLVLRRTALFFHEDSSCVYEPSDIVDLATVTRLDLSTHNPLTFKLRLLNGKSIHLTANTPQSLLEWTTAIQECLFRAQNASEYVRMVLSIDRIASLDLSPRSPSTSSVSLSDNELLITLIPSDNDNTSTTMTINGSSQSHTHQQDNNTFRFAHFENMTELQQLYDNLHELIAANRISTKLNISPPPPAIILSTDNTNSKPSSNTESSPSPSLAPQQPRHRRHISDLTHIVISKFKNNDSSSSLPPRPVITTVDSSSNTLQLPQQTLEQNLILPSVSLLPPSPIILPSKSTSDGANIHQHLNPPTSPTIRRDSGVTLVTGAINIPDKPYKKPLISHRKAISLDLGYGPLSRFTNLSSASTSIQALSVSIPTNISSILDKKTATITDLQLAKSFGLPSTQQLVIHSASVYLVRTIPRFGKLYLFNDYLCFLSRVVGLRITIVVPLRDVRSIQLEKPGVVVYYGLVITTHGGSDFYFDFRADDMRQQLHDILQKRILTSKLQNPHTSIKTSVTASTCIETEGDISNDINLNLQKSDVSEIKSSQETVNDISKFRSQLLLCQIPAPMQITVLTIGTRGDVQPFIALCKELQRDGHRCCIATHIEYESWVQSHGIAFRLLAGQPAEIMQLCVDNGMFSVSFIREVFANFRGWMHDLLITAWDACQDSDMIIESAGALNAGYHIAEKLQVPLFRTFLMPWTRTTAFPHPFATPDSKLLAGSLYNYVSFAMTEQLMWTGTQQVINKWRKQTLGLAPVWTFDASQVPFLYGFSSAIVPSPPDWQDWIHLCGYWFLDNPDVNWTPLPAFEQFLAQDPARTVYIGFGSIVVPDPDAITAIIIEAVQKANVRAVLSKGWSDRHSATGSAKKSDPVVFPDCIYEVKSVPHDWLFTRVKGAMHHGGSGTTAAALRAGIPSAIKPFFGDQHFWATRLQEIGVGINVKKLKVDRVAAALSQLVEDVKLQDKAHFVGEIIRQENGTRSAVEYIYRDIEYSRKLIQNLSNKQL